MNKLEQKQQIAERIPLLSNQELLEDTLCLAGGDDYDGCFTKLGAFEYDELQKELTKRLKEVGFLE